MLTIDRYHVPVVAPHGDGWGVHCLACSTVADDYVYECELRKLPQDDSRMVSRDDDPRPIARSAAFWDQWPPPVLVTPAD